MRSRVVVALFFVGSGTISAFAACGLDDSGLLPDGSVVAEGGFDVILDVPLDIAQGCTTLDASACFDGGLPGDWRFVTLLQGNVGCPGGYDNPAHYVINPVAEAGACVCGDCVTTGSYSCAGQVTTGATPNCTTTYSFDAGNTPGCFLTAKANGDPHLSVGPLPDASGTIVCDASVITTQVWSAGEVTTCTPSCDADFCDLPATARCVASPTATDCSGLGAFSVPSKVGPANAVSVSCSPCGCQVLPAPPCSATVQGFTSTDCGAGLVGNVAPDATCANFTGSSVQSFLYTPTVPEASCQPSGSGSAGSTTLSPFVMVCCVQ